MLTPSQWVFDIETAAIFQREYACGQGVKNRQNNTFQEDATEKIID
jgi:hypothetical protein